MRTLAAALALVTSATLVTSACSPSAAVPFAPVSHVALQGTWVNERGSVLTLDAADADGRLRGSFRSAVGAVDATRSFPVVGIVNGDVIGFSVSFGSAGSVASWNGQLTSVDGAERMVTVWHLTREVADADEASALWSSTMTGADVFRR